MENYVIAELEIVALAADDTIGASDITLGKDELPIDTPKRSTITA